MTPAPMERSAIISPCGLYRYRLDRRWAPGDPLVWVGLNPSEADAERDDPTLRRIIDFSRQHGYNACTLLNLFALRSPKPAALGRALDPVGPDNLDHLSSALAASTVVACWGAHPAARARGNLLRRSATAAGITLWCLGVTRRGDPVHPLYQPAGLRLRPWVPSGSGSEVGA